MSIQNPEVINFLNKSEVFLNIQEIPREASIREYYRIEYKDINKILCIDNKFDSHDYPFLLVQNFLRKNGFNVPEIYDFDIINHLILQSDVGNKDLTHLDDKNYEYHIKLSLNEILKLQELNPIPIIETRSFNYEKLNFEISNTFSAYERIYEKNKNLPMISLAVKNFLDETIHFLSKYKDKVICHRDYHARNITINDNGSMFWIDFQDMMMGVPQYDLVSILYDAYRPISTKLREKLYEYFKENSKHKNKKFRENYLTQALQRSFKALGTYFVMFYDKSYEKYGKSIPGCLDNLIEITQLGRFPDSLYLFFKELRESEEISKLK